MLEDVIKILIGLFLVGIVTIILIVFAYSRQEESQDEKPVKPKSEQQKERQIPRES